MHKLCAYRLKLRLLYLLVVHSNIVLLCHGVIPHLLPLAVVVVVVVPYVHIVLVAISVRTSYLSLYLCLTYFFITFIGHGICTSYLVYHIFLWWILILVIHHHPPGPWIFDMLRWEKGTSASARIKDKR